MSSSSDRRRGGSARVKDLILHSGFGFAKTVEQNWQLLREMAVFQEFGKDILVGLSRKSFLFQASGHHSG